MAQCFTLLPSGPDPLGYNSNPPPPRPYRRARSPLVIGWCTCASPCSFEEEKLQENVGHFGGSRWAQPRKAPLPRLPLGHNREWLMLEQLQSRYSSAVAVIAANYRGQRTGGSFGGGKIVEGRGSLEQREEQPLSSFGAE